MAIDIDQILEDQITAPKSMTNAAGETVVAASASEVLAILDRIASRKTRRPPFRVTLAIPPGTVGPRSPTIED